MQAFQQMALYLCIGKHGCLRCTELFWDWVMWDLVCGTPLVIIGSFLCITLCGIAAGVEGLSWALSLSWKNREPVSQAFPFMYGLTCESTRGRHWSAVSAASPTVTERLPRLGSSCLCHVWCSRLITVLCWLGRELFTDNKLICCKGWIFLVVFFFSSPICFLTLIRSYFE